MKQLFGAVLILTVSLAGLTAQSTWRGQAEVWQGAGAPTGGYVAAANEFTKNSLVTIENYKTKKTVQVRIVSTLPQGSSSFILISAKAAAALDIALTDTPLVGVQIDTTIGGSKGIVEDDTAQNPDPDVNPLATAKPKVAAGTPVASTPVPLPATAETPTPALTNTPATPTPVDAPSESPIMTPAPVVAAVSPASKPASASEEIPVVLLPQAPVAPTLARTGAATTNPAELTKASSSVDPELTPLPPLEAPPPVAPPSLAVADMSEETAPVTPGRRVFLPTTGTDIVADETPVVEETPGKKTTPEAESKTAVEPVAPAPETVAETPTPAPVVTPAPVATPAVAETPKATETPPAVVEAPKSVTNPPVVETLKADVTSPAVSATTKPATVTSAPPAAAKAWVSTPGKLSGPVLGTIGVLTQLEKGKSYVQVAAYATQAEVLKVLESMSSYVPVSVYQATGEKNPWRILIDSAPKAQMGVLLNQFRNQGFRTASIIKG